MKVLRKHALPEFKTAYLDIGCFSYVKGLLKATDKEFPMIILYRNGRFIGSRFKLNTITGRTFIEQAKSLEGDEHLQNIKFDLFMNECEVEEEERLKRLKEEQNRRVTDKSQNLNTDL